ncbi:hypothetical protein NP233_g3331 [Leucocoprinus birnbaumii]|uniref:Protein kinase domain-containing protein n=1 Tax=Leucocoprinus birnbaumii TaxID=56174 RepID=A0AAD5YYE6_9AGAR|nr:hypothetical protein NP233_g3331 [Leucocoprinus birnbaumii]
MEQYRQYANQVQQRQLHQIVQRHRARDGNNKYSRIAIDAPDQEDGRSAKAVMAATEDLVASAIQTAGDRELRKAFTERLSDKTKEVESSIIINYLNHVPTTSGNRPFFEMECVLLDPESITVPEYPALTSALQEYVREVILWSHYKNILPLYGIYSLNESSERIVCSLPSYKMEILKRFLRRVPIPFDCPWPVDTIPTFLPSLDSGYHHWSSGLVYLHSLTIVHGDLRAQNDLISENLRLLVANFGLSYIAMTAVAGSTQLSSSGTTNWMAPELIVHENPKPTKMSDMWSFGYLCYAMYTGK